MADGRLGCARDYQVQLTWVARVDSDGDPLPNARLHQRGLLTGVTNIRWERAYNEIAGAVIEIGSDDAAPPCTDLLSEIQPCRGFGFGW